MASTTTGASRQLEMFGRSTEPTIPIDSTHRLVQLADALDWTALELLAQTIRRRKLKSRAGRKPHLRALLGAVILMGLRRLNYRDAEDQIRYYAPARYLCGLTESKWTPDFTTIQDFTELMGEEGVRQINQFVVKLAVDEKLADPRTMVADTTAQEAAIGHPNEMGLMTAFLTAVVAATKRVGRAVPNLLGKLSTVLTSAKKKLREYRLFAKAQEAKNRLMTEMAKLVGRAQKNIAHALKTVTAHKDRLVGYGKVAWCKLQQLQSTMSRLLPQILSWLRTKRVAVGKIINIHIPELYAIVRGKIGKKVEFGLRWGMRRLRGGFLLATMARSRTELQDSDYAVRAVDEHIALFGKAPRAYAYDRAGYSAANIAALRERKVKHIAVAPRGKARWPVGGQVKKRLVRERAQIEGGIGAVKSTRYGFHRPAARSTEMMGACGQRSVLGLNLNKLARGLAARKKIALTG